MNIAKPIITSLAVLPAHQPAIADWVYLGSAKNGLYDYYLRPELIKTDGDFRSTWVMFNYPSKRDQVKSSIALNEYNCEQNTVRTNYLIQYDGEFNTMENWRQAMF